MRAAFYRGKRSVGLHDVPDPIPAAGEVVVRVRACGICGSDLHRYREGGFGSGLTPGHEVAGEVAAVGAGVSGWTSGARVAIEPIDYCGSCSECLRGDYQICPEWRILGAHMDGGLADYVRVPAHALFALPPEMQFDAGAVLEPMAVAVHGIRTAGVQSGHRVLVQGSGTIGLLTGLVAATRGAHVTLTARYPHQAEAAARFGAALVLPADDGGEKELARMAAREPFDIVIETVGGGADTLVRAPALVRRGGTVCVLGIFFHPPPLGALALVLREVRMVGAITYGRTGGIADFDVAIQLLNQHRDLVSSLITYRRPLGSVVEAFALADDKSSRALKVIIEP